MRKKFAVVVAALLVLSFLYGCKKEPEAPAAPEITENNFYYKDIKWGASVDEIIALNGEPDSRNDVDEDNENSEEPAADKPKLIDFLYNDKTLFDIYSVNEQYQFDENNQLEGVIADFNMEELSEDLTNMDELKELAQRRYLDIKAMLSSEFGPPAAEYTAYRDGDGYKTEEILDFTKENAAVHASRWDGDNLRFVYILYYPNQLLLEMRYIPHDQETVNRVDAQKANESETGIS